MPAPALHREPGIHQQRPVSTVTPAIGAASSTTALTAAALKGRLEAAVMQAVLDDHIRQYPEARPSLGDLAVAAAELDGHPLAGEPARIRQAALEVEARHPDAEPEDVLLWAEARAIPTS
jgi:hypothetical protein